MPDIVTSKTFVDGEKGITATKMNQIISGAVIQPAFYSAKPASSTLDPTDQLLELKGTGSYATITGQQLIDSVSASVTQNISPTIWSVRQRSFNSIGNPTFEVDQRNSGVALTNPAAGVFVQDRWLVNKSVLTGTVNTALQNASSSPIVIPGTNFGITQKYQRFTVGTAQTSLAAGDYYFLYQVIEGPRWRELALDVHSVSLLVRSSVSGLAFSLALSDITATHSLVRLCTISSANIWQLIPLPNLPVWSGTYDASPGQLAYQMSVTLACGTTKTQAANTAWQNGSVYAVTGTSNFLATAGATFDIAFCSHEPGAQCSNPPMDCSFTQCYDDCLRYFQKSYDYATAIGSVTANNAFYTMQMSVNALSGIRFIKPMARTPTGATVYNHSNGAANSFQHSTGANYAVSAINGMGQVGIASISTATMPAATPGSGGYCHLVADTGW